MNREPELCVIKKTKSNIIWESTDFYDFKDDLIVEYVQNNYVMIKEIGPFLIFEPK